jgi:HD-GYP domain-containing protein (c-di-GMP phosphodiesterase class II)
MSAANPHGVIGSHDPTQEAGHHLARSLHLAMRTVRTHDLNNDIGVQSIQTLTDAFNRLVSDQGTYDLHIVSDFLYVGNTRLREDKLTHKYIRLLIDELTTRGIGSISLYGTVTPDEVRFLIELLHEFPHGDTETVNQIKARLSSFDSTFGVGPVRREEDLLKHEVDEIDKRERCKKAFFKALTVTEGLMKSVHMGKRLELRFAKRVMHQMVDLITDEEFTLLGLTTLKSHDNYTYYHSVNVSVYAISLGKRLGLSRPQLSDLGVGALLHDLGKVKIPTEVLHKKGALTQEDWTVIRRHPVEGAKEIIRVGGLSTLALRALIGCFEHHMNHDGSLGGYPNFRERYAPHLIGRIVGIADVFDAITTKRVYMNEPTPRDKALSFMLSQSGKKFDSVLLRIFVNMIGVYPIGTMVRLRSGRIAVVVATPKDPKLCHRPIVRPVSNEAGLQLDGVSYPDLDLSERGPDGRYADEIEDSIDPASIGTEASRYFI